MAWAGTMDSTWEKENGEQKLLFGKWMDRLHLEKASCVWGMETPALHSQAQAAKDTVQPWRMEGRRWERTRSLLANSPAAQLTPAAWKLLLKRSEHTAATRGEHHVTKSGIYMETRASCWQGYRDSPKYPNQHTPGPNELLRWWYAGFWHLTGFKNFFHPFRHSVGILSNNAKHGWQNDWINHRILKLNSTKRHLSKWK